ncbi:MAG: hypothetical protein LBE98_01675 [Puniceicoccales bacterium]|nr:hypothetical protein [Puniceicoccales bacterium]
MPRPIVNIDPEKTNSFLRKLRALQRTDPAKLIPLIMDSGVESMPGCVEFNIARALGTSVNQVRAWCSQSSDFREAVNILSTSRTAELLAKLEEGELPAASVDRLVYANIGEGFEPPRIQKAINAEVSLGMINMGNIASIMDTKAPDGNLGDGPQEK